MVRLKDYGNNNRKYQVLPFQFHYGSIKGLAEKPETHAWYWFQFHYGSIKGHIRPSVIKPWMYFNSTMVRLKAGSIRFYLGMVNEFQFHYGSIKGFFRNEKRSLQILFQFHYGSIKGALACPTTCQLCLFQFHYGSIKGLQKWQTPQALHHFNSTMVRLKVIPVGLHDIS